MENTTLYPRLTLPDDRLKTAASLVRPGGVVCDVGTDHGYIPIWLLQQGVCRYAVASDINRGPLDRARENGFRYGVADRLKLYVSDGLDRVEPAENGITDICICGMGGELIASIVDRFRYTRRPEVQLILQPMSNGYKLRQYLTGAGFSICKEKLCQGGGRVYSCMTAVYTGISENWTPRDLTIGRVDREDSLFPAWLEKHSKALEKQIRGRKMGGLDTAGAETLYTELKKLEEVKSCDNR